MVVPVRRGTFPGHTLGEQVRGSMEGTGPDGRWMPTRAGLLPAPKADVKQSPLFRRAPGPSRGGRVWAQTVQEGLPKPARPDGSVPGPALSTWGARWPPFENPESWAVLHKRGQGLGTQGEASRPSGEGAVAPAGGGCLHSESEQMWDSHCTLVHGGRR